MIVIRCPKCNSLLNVDEKYIGKEGRCNKCHSRIVADVDHEVIPEFEPLQRTKPVETNPLLEPSQPHVSYPYDNDKPVNKMNWKTLVTIAGVLMVLVFIGSLFSNGSKPMTKENRVAALVAAEEALKESNFKDLYSVKFSDTDYLVIDIHLNSEPINPKGYCENVMLIVRNKLYGSGLGISKYRVSLYGPRPGPGLVHMEHTDFLKRVDMFRLENIK